MKTSILFIFLLSASFSFAQMRRIDKVYVVEGIVADRETNTVIPSAILYNDSLNIMTTSDKRGYYKIVVPFDLIKERKSIRIDILKNGYKRDGWGFSFNPSEADTNNVLASNETQEVWCFSVNILELAKEGSQLGSTSGACIYAKEEIHGYDVVKLSFENEVASRIKWEKLEQLKSGNEKVYFQIDKQPGFATSKYDMIGDKKMAYVFIDDKKVKLSDVNKIAKRSAFFVDDKKCRELTLKYGKDIFAFVTTDPSPSKSEK